LQQYILSEGFYYGENNDEPDSVRQAHEGDNDTG